MNGGREKRRWRSQKQCSSKENEHVSAEIERIPREPVRTGRDQRALRSERDHTHFVPIEVDRRPYAQKKSERQKQNSGRGHERGSKARNAQDRIHHRAKVRESQSHEHHADVMKNAFEKNHYRLVSH